MCPRCGAIFEAKAAEQKFCTEKCKKMFEGSEESSWGIVKGKGTGRYRPGTGWSEGSEITRPRRI